MAMRRKIFTFVALCILAQSSRASDDQAQNLAELSALCQLIKLADADMSELPKLDTTGAQIETLEVLKMTLAESQWQAKYPNKETPELGEKAACQEQTNQPQCEAEFKKWAHLNIKASSKESANPANRIPTALLSTPAASAARLALTAIIAEATALQAEFDTKYKPNLENLEAKLKADLNTAAYNSPVLDDTKNQRCEITKTGNTEELCALPAVGEALCATLTCVCSKFGDTQNTDVCGSGATETLTENNAASHKTGYDTIHSVCAKYPPEKMTAELIESKIAALKGTFKTIGSSGAISMALGIIGTSNQCKNVANTACTDFTKSSPFKSGETATPIAWEMNLRKAAEKLKKADEAAIIQKKTNAVLRSYTKRAEAIVKRLLLEKPPASEIHPAVAQQQHCNIHTTNTTCTANNCK
uniref:Variant surface glycoprotein 1125.4980 n=1 Tax=Trypanosoma brucei TaxID=5691 RepID=A0A1J0RBD2_9TRYP|nr:variant surface glycoprotein 1125.4980 [Trypanosoma brucei]